MGERMVDTVGINVLAAEIGADVDLVVVVCASLGIWMDSTEDTIEVHAADRVRRHVGKEGLDHLRDLHAGAISDLRAERLEADSTCFASAWSTSASRAQCTDVAWSPDGVDLASVSADERLRFWTEGDPRWILSADSSVPRARALAWRADGLVAVGCEDKVIRLGYPGSMSSWTPEFVGHKGWIFGVVWSPDGSILASAGGDNTVRAWRPGSSEPVWTAQLKGSSVWGIDWSPDGDRLVSSGANGVHLLDSSTGEVLSRLGPMLRGVPNVKWSPSGESIAAAAHSGEIAVFDSASGAEISRLVRDRGDMTLTLSWDDSGLALAAGYASGKIRIWHPGTGVCPHRFAAHRGRTLSIAWSPDSSRLASGASDGSVTVWRRDRATDVGLVPATGKGVIPDIGIRANVRGHM